MRFTINKKEFIRYEIIELDVWGNKRDGFDLNNLFKTGEYISLPVEFTDKQLILELKRAGVIKRNIRYTSIGLLYFDDGNMICIEDSRTGEPALQLHAG